MNGHEPRHLKQTAADSRAHSGRQSVSARAGKPASKIRRDIDIERVEKALDRSLIRKNTANICVSAVILLLGVTSFLYGLTLEPSVTIFRFLTVDGTLFTTCGALACIIINLVEIFRREDIVLEQLKKSDRKFLLLVLIPIFIEALIFLVIPILGVASFLFNDSPIGKLSPGKCLLGASYVSVYAVIIVTLISTERLPTELIPYFFLDYRTNGIGIFLLAFVFVYTVAYLMGWGLSVWNRKCSWLWFRDLVGSAKKK